MDSRVVGKTRSPANPVGDLLRGWRFRRAMSLSPSRPGFRSSISAMSRPAQPRPAARPQLAAALALSLRDRNALLEAGGFPRQYCERDLAAPELNDARRAIDLLLRVMNRFRPLSRTAAGM
jgi:hypothetical protein